MPDNKNRLLNDPHSALHSKPQIRRAAVQWKIKVIQSLLLMMSLITSSQYKLKKPKARKHATCFTLVSMAGVLRVLD